MADRHRHPPRPARRRRPRPVRRRVRRPRHAADRVGAFGGIRRPDRPHHPRRPRPAVPPHPALKPRSRGQVILTAARIRHGRPPPASTLRILAAAPSSPLAVPALRHRHPPTPPPPSPASPPWLALTIARRPRTPARPVTAWPDVRSTGPDRQTVDLASRAAARVSVALSRRLAPSTGAHKLDVLRARPQSHP